MLMEYYFGKNKSQTQEIIFTAVCVFCFTKVAQNLLFGSLLETFRTVSCILLVNRVSEMLIRFTSLKTKCNMDLTKSEWM